MVKFRPEELPPGPHREKAEALAAAVAKETARQQSRLNGVVGGDTGTVVKRKASRPEQHLQIGLIAMAAEWPMATLLNHLWPDAIRKTYLIEWLYHIPNGGHRSAAEAAIFKAMGVKPGVSDLFLSMPTSRYAGLYMELKAGKGELTDAQIAFCKAARSVGYDVAEVRMGSEFQECVIDYFRDRAPFNYYAGYD